MSAGYEFELTNKQKFFLYLYECIPNIELIKHIYTLYIEEKDKFVTYHIKNMFGLVIILFITTTFFEGNEFLEFIGQIAWVTSFFLWVYSLLMAITGKQKGIPILTDLFQKWFKFLDQ